MVLAAAVVYGPSLLSAEQPGADGPAPTSAPSPSTSHGGPAVGWTGADRRPAGNLFVPGSARRLRLPQIG